jgi:glycosyltransferase involved in cell wall biosynthesis
MPPLVSILIPAFNAQAHIAETLGSALAQTWPRTEIIVVDDGSRDETLAIARRFGAKNVLVTTQPNQGAAAARNRAFALAQGDYIQWLDADDLLAPDKIARQLAAVGAPPTTRLLLSGPWGRFLHRAHRARFVPTPLWCDLTAVEWLVRSLELGAYMQTATWLVSRALTVAAGPWDTRLLGDDDGEYFCRVGLASEGIRFVPGASVFYRMSSGSLSHVGTSNRKLEAHFLGMRLQMEHLRARDDTAGVRAACLRYLQRYMPMFYPQRPDLVRQAIELAESLGGTLTTPALPPKYAWIQRCFGWRAARHAQVVLPQSKWSLIRLWDRTASYLDRSFIPT